MSHHKPNFSASDLSASRPRLRRDLQIHFQDNGYVLEDPVAGSFFHLGAVEHRFTQLLDGSLSLAEAIGRLSVEAEAAAFSEEAAVGLIRALADSNLLEDGGSEHAERVRDDIRRKDDSQNLTRKGGSLLFLRIPLGNPDRLLDLIAPYFRWLFTPWFLLVWCAVIITGIISVGQNWMRFREESSGMFEAGNLFFLGLIWIVLKICHESWHALACKHFGGAVPEAGVVLLLFVTPLGYVNATSATGFPSKWQRIFVSVAGIYGELFAAGIAAIIWSQLEPGLLSRALFEVIVLSSVTTLLFNANPLMRFDGYYILADLTGVPNLYSKAQRNAAFWFRRWFLGANPDRCPVPRRDRGKWITAYGVAAFFWRITIVIGILAFVSHCWNGAGLIAGIIAALGMLAAMAKTTHRYFKKQAISEGVPPFRTAVRFAVGMALVAILLGVVRISPEIRVPAAVDWESNGEVRVDCPGFVEQRFVENGARVKAGDRLALIRNLDEEAGLRQLHLEVRRLEIVAAQYLQVEDIAAQQATDRQIEALKVKLAGLQKYVGSLEVKAPCDGVVIGQDFASGLDGTYVEKGRLLCTVGRAEAKKLVLAVPQDQTRVLRLPEKTRAEFRARGRLGTFPAELSRINPHASNNIPHFGLIAPANGPLVTRRNPGTQNEEEAKSADARIHADSLTRQFELAKPHFEAIAELDETTSRRLETGEVGYVRLRAGERQSLWALLRDEVARMYRKSGERKG